MYENKASQFCYKTYHLEIHILYCSLFCLFYNCEINAAHVLTTIHFNFEAIEGFTAKTRLVTIQK